MELVSLKTIVKDLIKIIRASRVSDDEPISERQVETWVHQYRSVFIKRDIDKGKMPNPDYIQNIDNLSLEYDSTRDAYKTTVDIPVGIDFNQKYGITYVGDIAGNQIQLLPEKRVNWQQYNKWTQDETLAYLNANRLYIHNSKGLNKISIRGIFENPIEAAEANGETYNYDSVYPLPQNLIPVIKKEILEKELNIIWKAPSDTKNDSHHGLNK